MSTSYQSGIPGSKEFYKITGDEVEFKEKQFMDDVPFSNSQPVVNCLWKP